MLRVFHQLIFFCAISAFLSGTFPSYALANVWQTELRSRVAKIDDDTPGRLGVFIKRTGEDGGFEYNAERKWYLSSTVKVPVAIALLQKVDKGELDLRKTVTLKESDFVDGSGDVLSRKPGEKLTLAYLLDRMLIQSDSSAADLLIREIGVKELNERLGKITLANGFAPITTILQVRYDAYGEVHPLAKELTNRDFIELKRSRTYGARFESLRKKMRVEKKELKAKSLEEAFDRYYKTGLNSASLVAYADLLEKLGNRELLSADSTDLLLSLMAKMETGESRLKAGFPPGTKFSQKTGTQLGRICNMGIATPPDHKAPLVIAACVEGDLDVVRAEKALQRLGKAIAQSPYFAKTSVQKSTR